MHTPKAFWPILVAVLFAGVIAVVAHDVFKVDEVIEETFIETMPEMPVAPPIDGGTTFSQHIDELAAPVSSTYYECADGKNFMARVEVRPEGMGNSEVFLNDGSKLLLAQTLSASGARYANSGESFVFWTKGNTAFIEEGGETVYADCVAQES